MWIDQEAREWVLEQQNDRIRELAGGQKIKRSLQRKKGSIGEGDTSSKTDIPPRTGDWT